MGCFSLRMIDLMLQLVEDYTNGKLFEPIIPQNLIRIVSIFQFVMYYYIKEVDSWKYQVYVEDIFPVFMFLKLNRLLVFYVWGFHIILLWWLCEYQSHTKPWGGPLEVRHCDVFSYILISISSMQFIGSTSYVS
jgi:hypothetical protein